MNLRYPVALHCLDATHQKPHNPEVFKFEKSSLMFIQVVFIIAAMMIKTSVNPLNTKQ